MYGARGLDREPFPYVNGNGRFDSNEAGDLEYPVGTGYFVAAVARVVHTNVGFFRLSALGLGIAGALAAILLVLTAEDRRRILFFALAPSLVSYAFLNWDLLAVLAVAAGFWAYTRRAETWAGVALGIGAATKLYPVIFVPVLALAIMHRDRRAPTRLLAGAAGAFVAMNLPILLANPSAWWFPWEFQSTRFPNYETVWYFVSRHAGDGSTFWIDSYPGLTSALSLGLFTVAASVLLWREWRREVFRPGVASLGVLLLFLITAKVYSPQYALWVLPFFVLVRTHGGDFAAFTLADTAVWIAIAAFLLTVQYQHGDQVLRENLLEAAVFARYAVLGVLLVRSRRMTDNLRLAEVPAPPVH